MNEFEDFDYSGHKESASKFAVSLLAVIVALISMSTTFGFFATYFANFFSQEAIGHTYAATASGVVGVILFDVGTIVSLYAFLHAARTAEQRAISVFLLVFNFTISGVASAAHIYLTAATGLVLEQSAMTTISNLAMLAVVAGVVVNFGMWIAYSFYSQESKLKRLEHKRQDALNRAQAQQLASLAAAVAKKTGEFLNEAAEQMAEEQAHALADRFKRRELDRYAQQKSEQKSEQKPEQEPDRYPGFPASLPFQKRKKKKPITPRSGIGIDKPDDFLAKKKNGTEGAA